jgi:hypothetical protein
MSSITDIAAVAEDQVLGTLKQGQDIILDALKQWTTTVESYTPDSLVVDFPNPTEAVDVAFSFVEKVLASQRQFVGSVLETVAAIAS